MDKPTLKVFISYKWEDDAHNEWVKKFATDLRAAGIDAKLDRWEVRLGDSFTDYMTSKINEADAVLFIMTTRSIAAVEAPKGEGGAVKFEMQMATSKRIAGEKMRLIGIFREGTATPAHLRDHRYADFRNDSEYEIRLKELIDDLSDEDSRPPLLTGSTRPQGSAVKSVGSLRLPTPSASPLTSQAGAQSLSTPSRPATALTQSKLHRRRGVLLTGGLGFLLIISVILVITAYRNSTRPTEPTNARAEIIFGRVFSAESMITLPASLSVKYADEILKVEGVEAAVPVITYPTMRTTGVGIEQVEGVDWTPYAAMNHLSIISGRPSRSDGEVMIDEIKARDNKLSVGDQLTLFGRPFYVTGIYAPAFGGRVKMPLGAMQDSLEAPRKCTYILVKCRNADEQVVVAHRLDAALPGNVIQFTRDVFK
ncbi:MAG TPA: TIR domain-containing protein [Pyrinomonadaceae bacterium]|jgi:hypothetical protein|nr:TIR domain-containing protein [Pyrinomonadaceae bacterium]